jgi:DNA-directed RNA polymerase III subunit RPC2
MALLAHITTDEAADTTPIERLCYDLGVEDACRMTGTEINSAQYYIVFLNGNILGIHKRPHDLVESLRKMRRRGLTGEFVSVYLHEGQRAVHLATDGGRVCRPLIIVDYETGRPKLKQRHVEALVMKALTIRDLLQQGIVEYVDCNEENNTLIAVTEQDLEVAIQQGLDNVKMRYTHLEIDPFTILGVVGGVIPVRCHEHDSVIGFRYTLISFFYLLPTTTVPSS